ncbi:MAG: S8 family peptidase [Acidobacteriota bacterium]
MTERPLLILPAPGEPAKRRTKGGGGGRFQRPDRERQSERLAPRLQELQAALAERRTRLQTEAQGLVPEEVVVLEAVGTVDGFIRAVEKIPGMEWLAEIEREDVPPDDDFFALDDNEQRRPDKALGCRLFMIFTNQSALQQMLSLWGSWQADQKLPHGLGRWKTLFEQLRDVRPWGPRDRLIETGVLDDWHERIEHGQEIVPCEIELWYRQLPRARQAAHDRVAGLVTDLQGTIIAESSLEEIGYHALLAHLPTRAIVKLLEDPNDDTALVHCEQIQFFRASGQMSTTVPDDEQTHDGGPHPTGAPTGTPVVALLDGLPLQTHQRLEGRLIVDDPDVFEENYPANERRHGTAMASLIIHGDLAADEAPLPRPLYVRPILQPDPRAWRRCESVPEGTLIVDLVHRAVRRLFESEGDQEPVGTDIAVINLSIGILDRPFERALSPLARLLDWLAWHYQVLFVVSAGNHTRTIELHGYDSSDTLTPEALQEQIIRSIAADARHRRLLSPAEATNALAVAAIHDDASNAPPPPGWLQPHTRRGLPSPINAQGMGYRRAIKPDILAPGGCVLVRKQLRPAEQMTLEVYGGTLAPGQLAAAPGPTPGDRAASRYSRGTSNATALVSRAAGLLHDVLDDIRGDPGGEIIDTVPRSVWLKALLAHGADWELAGPTLDNILGTDDNRRQFKEYVTRLLGYGTINLSRARECTERRATAISGGLLAKEQSHIHRFPLPPSLSGQRGHRRLTITLAWHTPVNPRHQGWRRADLWFAPPQSALRVSRQQADWQAVQRGTLQHEILDGEQAAVFSDGTDLEIQVSCRPDAGVLDEAIPYALVTTLEVAESIGVEIYDEVRVAIQTAQVRVSPTTSG